MKSTVGQLHHFLFPFTVKVGFMRTLLCHIIPSHTRVQYIWNQQVGVLSGCDLISTFLFLEGGGLQSGISFICVK